MRALLLPATLILALTTTATAEPIGLGFDGPTSRHARPTLVALTQDPAEPAALTPLPAAPTEGKAGHGTTIFGLPKNMGPIDRVARAVIGSALLGVGVWGLSTSGHLSGTTSGVLVGVSAIPFATAASGYCPLYQLVGVDYSF
jgi:hypothetical protein